MRARIVGVVILGLAAGLRVPAVPAGDPSRPGPRLVVIPSPAAPGARTPDFTRMPDGRVIMSWVEPRAGAGLAFRCASFDGRRWSAPATIAAGESLVANWANSPGVQSLGVDRLAAHYGWRRGAGGEASDVHVNLSGDGGKTWGPSVVPHRDATDTEHAFVSLVPDARGVVAVWLDGRKTAGHREHDPGPEPEMSLRAALVTRDGRLAEEAELDGRACDCCQTAAVATDRGIVVAYRDRSPDELRDISIVRQKGGVWSGPSTLHADGWRIAGCPVNGPAMAAAGSRVGVVWFTAAADTPRVRCAFSDDGGETFGPPLAVDDGAPLGRVHMLMLEDGRTLVTWLEARGKEAQVRARWISPAAVPGRAFTVGQASAVRASGFPRVVRSGQTILFAWTIPGNPSRIRVASLSGR